MCVSVLRGEHGAQLVLGPLVEIGVAVALLLAEVDGGRVSGVVPCVVPLVAVVLQAKPRARGEQHGYGHAEEPPFQRGHGFTSSGRTSRRCSLRPSMIETSVSA